MEQTKIDSANSEQADTASSITNVTIEQVNQVVNAAISNRFKTFEKKLDEFSTKFQPLPVVQEEPKEKVEKISNLELVKLKQQFDAMQKERDSELSKRKDFELRNNVKETLLKSGVSQNLLKAAMAVLIDSDKLIGYNEEDQIVFKTESGEVDLLSGLKTWVKTDEGKSFVAPKGSVGSGEKSFSSKPSNSLNLSAKPSRQEVGNALEEVLLGGWKT